MQSFLMPCNLFTHFCEQIAPLPAAVSSYRMNLSRIRAALEEARVHPIKTHGQNLLHDRNLSHWIVTQAEIDADDFILYIGARCEALTEDNLTRDAIVNVIHKYAP